VLSACTLIVCIRWEILTISKIDNAVGSEGDLTPDLTSGPNAENFIELGGGPFNLAPGEWTDDTSMALCLADSLIEMGGFDPIDQLERYVAWFRKGYLSSNGCCFDFGIATAASLSRFESTHEPYPGSTAQNTAGNGSLMRLAPVPMFYARHPQIAIEKSADSSRTTMPIQRPWMPAVILVLYCSGH
jgi:ADP-ribosylglycohydrolase